MGVHHRMWHSGGAVCQTLVVHPGLIAVVLTLPEPPEMHPAVSRIGPGPEERRQRLWILDPRVARTAILGIGQVDAVRRRNREAGTRLLAFRTTGKRRPRNCHRKHTRDPPSNTPGLTEVHHHESLHQLIAERPRGQRSLPAVAGRTAAGSERVTAHPNPSMSNRTDHQIWSNHVHRAKPRIPAHMR
jgi:hypothetical protein